ARLHSLSFFVELVRGQSAHEVDGREQLMCFHEIEPGVVSLPLGLVLARLLHEPVAVVAGHLRGLRVESTQLPLRSGLFENKRQCVRRLAAGDIENCYSVSAGRQIWDHKYRAVRGLTIRAKNSAEELRPLHGLWRLFLEKINRARSG